MAVYTDAEREAVWSLMCDGFGNTPIHRILREGEGPLGYRLDIPVATLKGMRRRLIDERGDPRPILQPEDESKAYSAARRQLGSALVNQSKRLTGRAARSGELSGKDLADAIRIEKALADIENRAAADDRPRSRESGKNKRGHETRRADDTRTLAAMAARNPENDESPADGEALTS